MIFSPVSILPRRTSEKLDRHPAWRGRGILGFGYLLARAIGAFAAGVLLVHLVIVLFTLGVSELYSYVNPPLTSLMIDRKIQYGVDVRPVRFLPLSKIPLYVRHMFVMVEDKNFYSEPGIDIEAIKNAWKIDRKAGEWRYGASTITQQLTRSLFLTTRKTLARKYVEVLMSLTLNLVMSKQRQLELYLNYIEWGRGIFGIQQAAYSQYGKPLSKLTTDQIIRLAAIITSPWQYNVHNLFENHAMLERYRFMWWVVKHEGGG